MSRVRMLLAVVVSISTLTVLGAGVAWAASQPTGSLTWATDLDAVVGSDVEASAVAADKGDRGGAAKARSYAGLSGGWVVALDWL